MPYYLNSFKEDFETHYRILGKKLILDLIPLKTFKKEFFQDLGLICQFLDFTVLFNSELKFSPPFDSNNIINLAFHIKNINIFFQFTFSVEGHLSNATLNIDYLKNLKSNLKTEKTFFMNLLINIILFASFPFCKKFEFDFESDAKELSYKIRNMIYQKIFTNNF